MRHLIASFCFALFSLAAQADGSMEKTQVKGSFDETKEALVTAIENRGLVINYTSHIADMLARTGADLGATKKIYDKAEIIEFCSAGLSRKMMETDPHNIVSARSPSRSIRCPARTGAPGSPTANRRVRPPASPGRCCANWSAKSANKPAAQASSTAPSRRSISPRRA